MYLTRSVLIVLLSTLGLCMAPFAVPAQTLLVAGLTVGLYASNLGVSKDA